MRYEYGFYNNVKLKQTKTKNLSSIKKILYFSINKLNKLKMIKKIRGIQPNVRRLLIHSEECRDNDQLLYLKLCALIDPLLRSSNATYLYFGTELLKGNLPALESVTRARRKIQEEEPELRGKFYNKRKEKEVEVRSLINE